MSETPYEVALNRPARRALTEKLPLDVAMRVSEFITGPLGDNPYRVGKELDAPLEEVYSARVMHVWHVLHNIDEENRLVTVRDIRHRRDADEPPLHLNVVGRSGSGVRPRSPAGPSTRASYA